MPVHQSRYSLLLCLLLPLLAAAQKPAGQAFQQDTPTQEIRYWYRNFDNHTSFGLLQLALRETEDDFGPYRIIRSEYLTQGRAQAELEKGNSELIRVMDVVADDGREQRLLPVKVATDGGLIGMRVCIIRKADQPRFNALYSKADVVAQRITFGQGAHWPDTRILAANGLEVMSSARFETLYRMLSEERFDCFLRGANEVQEDLQRYTREDLAIENTLLFSYPSSSFFFVSRQDQLLARRLQTGLQRAIRNGHFDEYFSRHFGSAVRKLNLMQRRVIHLDNPLLNDNSLLYPPGRFSLSAGQLETE